MKKIVKLKICNWILLVFTAAILASGIQLEAIQGRGVVWVVAHIVIGLIFMGLCAYHVFLNIGKGNWFAKFHKVKSPVTRIIWWLGIITLLTGLIACMRWSGTLTHSPIGGVHGKIGFLMILFAIGHIVKRMKFFKK